MDCYVCLQVLGKLFCMASLYVISFIDFCLFKTDVTKNLNINAFVILDAAAC